MKAKATKPAAKKAAPKKPAAKKATVTKIVRKSSAKKVGASGGVCLQFIGTPKKPSTKPRFLAVSAKATNAPQLLPLQPPAFEPVLRTAAQWRSAARAVSK